MPVEIINATDEHVVRIVDMAQSLCDAAKCERWWVMSRNDTAAFVRHCIHDQESGCALVVVDDGDVCGCLVGAMRFVPLNASVKFAQEVILWVEPKHRGKKIGEKLVEYFVNWAENNCCELVAIGYTHGCTDKSVKAICERMKFEPLETMHIRRF
jgi:GNAT superfamily N-acetyltransferase